MSEVLQEFVDSGNQRLRVDRAAGIIRGVKLLGLASRNGRRYRESALTDAVSLYEGAKVNINHPKGHPLSPRDYQDRLGVVRGVAFRSGEGIFGDLHFNPKHALSEQLVWDAENAPQNVGMSHNVLARTTQDGSDVVVEAITKVQSIDLVADPATTGGLYEHASSQSATANTGADSSSPVWDELTLEELRYRRPDLVREAEVAFLPQFEQLQNRLDEMAAREQASHRREHILQLLQEHGLPLPGNSGRQADGIVSEHFIDTLMTASDAKTRQRLIQERAELVRSARRWDVNGMWAHRGPRSKDQIALALGTAEKPIHNGQQLAAAIRGA